MCFNWEFQNFWRNVRVHSTSKCARSFLRSQYNYIGTAGAFVQRFRSDHNQAAVGIRMWTYNQSNGSISREGKQIGVGYSGAMGYVNNPAFQSYIGLGPIPSGTWRIGAPVDLPNLGPHVMSLTPDADTDTYGRGGFFIHGDEIEFAGQFRASHGCIILARSIREQISASGDAELQVV